MQCPAQDIKSRGNPNITEISNSAVGGLVSDIGSVMSDVGDIYYRGFENLFGGAHGQRKLTGRGHSASRNTPAHLHADPEPLHYHSNELPEENHQLSYQNLDYNTGSEGSSNWEREEESNYLYYDHGPTTTFVEDTSLNQQSYQQSLQYPHEHTSTEAPDFDYSTYDEYLYLPNYLEEVEDDFR